MAIHTPFSLFLALKYLSPKRTYTSVVTVISIIGVMLGVAILLIVLSVMTGFDDMWRDKILGFNAHITLVGHTEIEYYSEMIEELEQIKGVSGAAPFIQGIIFIKRRGNIQTPFVKGVDLELERNVSQIPSHITKGVYSLDDEEMLVGKDLAERLGLRVGDKVLVYSPRHLAMKDELFLPEELTVSGIFELGMYDFDAHFVLCSLDTTGLLCGYDYGVQGIQVMTDDPEHPEAVAALISERFPSVTVRTWKQMHRQLFATLQVEKNMMFFLLIFISIVAAFSIMNTLITVTVQKTHDIGLLKAIGFSPESIMGVFVLQGFICGFLGNLLGIGSGLLILHYRNDMMRGLGKAFGWELFPKELYRLSEIPANTHWSDIWTISVAVVVICTLAGLVPALRAARLDPVKALRYE